MSKYSARVQNNFNIIIEADGIREALDKALEFRNSLASIEDLNQELDMQISKIEERADEGV